MSRYYSVRPTRQSRGLRSVWQSRLTTIAVLAALSAPAAHALVPGHARLLSEPGEPLKLDLALSQLTPDEQNTLAVRLAPVDAWSAAGLRPPVSLDSLRVAVVAGRQGDARVVQLRSTESFEGRIADVLLDIESARGRVRHQVSVLAQADTRVRAPAATVTPAAAAPASSVPSVQALRVRRGDNLTRLARRHAPAGVTSFQWMVAVWQANPRAFIDNNLNLVRAGAALSLPDVATMQALSDREARRIFHDHVLRFAARRGADTAAATAMAEAAVADVASADASRGQLSAPASAVEPAAGHRRDQLRLSEPGVVASSAIASGGTAATAGTTTAAVGGVQAGGAQAGGAQVGGAQAGGGQGGTVVGAASGNTSGAAGGGTGTGGSVGTAVASSRQGTAAGTAAAPVMQAPGAATGAATGPSATPAAQASVSADARVAHSVGAAAAASGAVAAGSPPAAAAATPQSATGAAPLAPAASAASQDLAAAQERVSQLEANVQKLNQALRMQGEAAHKAVVDGATELSQSLTEMGEAVGEALAEVSKLESPSNDLSAALAVPGVSVGEQASLEETTATPAAEAVAGVAGRSHATASASPSAPSAAVAASPPAASAPSATPQADTEPGSWLARNALGLLTALFALIALIVAWVLRRANRRHEELPLGGNPITPEQVQRQLDNIDLNLDQPPPDEPRR